jgi:hypothetical protein
MPPRPEFSAEDYENPDAPEGERRLRADHQEVRDLSYERSRQRQLVDLFKGAMFNPGFDSTPSDPDTWIPQAERLEIYLKERPRGAGYVADFIYRSKTLPVLVYGVLINRGHGLEIAELELFRTSWGYFDERSEIVDGDSREIDADQVEEGHAQGPSLITSDLLRRIPIGRIIALAQQQLAQDDWRSDGVMVLMGPDRGPEELTAAETTALESGVTAARLTRRGRPPLPADLLKQVANAYLEESPTGPGLLRRLSGRFERPEATIRDWIAAARAAGYLTPARHGRRGAGPGPRLAGKVHRRLPEHAEEP